MRKRGKKLLDIEWKKQGVSLKIPVRAVTEYDHDKREDVMSFYVDHEDPQIKVHDTDINVVRKAVLSKIDAWYSVDWEIWLMVRVAGEKGPGDEQVGEVYIKFEMEFFAIGKDVRGKTLHVTIPRPERFDKPIGKPKIEPVRFGGHQPKDGLPSTGKNREYGYCYTQALVRATPENVKAADSFVDAMGALLEKMHHHFHPKRIEKLLGKAGQILLGQVAK